MSRSALFWGAALVIVGAVLLLDNLGFFGNINIWGLIWPLLIIAFGVWIIWGNFFRKSPETEHVSIPLESARQAKLRMQHGAGRLNISAGAGMGELLVGDFGGGLDVRKNLQGDRLDLNMHSPVQFFPFNWYPGSSLDWTVALSPEVPISLDLETGASDTRLDLSDLLIGDLYIKTGASSTKITLPSKAGYTSVKVESGAASVDVQIPAGVAARIRSRGGLSSLSVDRTRFPQTGDVYQSGDYDTAPNKADLDIQMGVGSVTVK